MAGVLVVVGSVLVVVSSFERMSGLRSLETREAIETALAEPPASGLGIGVSQVLDLLQVLVMVAAACGTATAILGYQALQRSRSARLALSFLAVPLALAGTVAGGIIAPLVAVAVLMLWVQPARDWYDGRVRPAEPGGRAAAHERTSEPAGTGVWDQPGGPPSTYAGPGQHDAQPDAQPDAGHPGAPQPGAGQPGAGQPGAGQPGVYPGPRPYAGFGATSVDTWSAPAGGDPATDAPRPRPAAVAWACAVTWAAAVLVAVGMVLSASALALAPEDLMEQFRKQEPELAEQVSQDLLVTVTVVMTVIVTACCLAAVVLAAPTFRRTPWARVALIVSACLAGGVCLLGVLSGSLPLVVPLAACSLAVALLARPESRQWFAARGATRA